MNVADVSLAPLEYQNVAWIADACTLIVGVGWTANYIGMIRKSLKDQTYSMALLALCCNFAWEFTYGLIYSFGSDLDRWVHYTGLMINFCVMYTAVKSAPREWAHAPLVQKNIVLIFIISILGWISFHSAVAVQFGPAMGQAWSAYVCQLLLDTGALCQLLSRSSSRGTSFTLWFCRFVGSVAIVPLDLIRYRYWKEVHGHLASPIYLWFVGVFLMLNVSYGICLWYVRRFEKEQAATRKLKM